MESRVENLYPSILTRAFDFNTLHTSNCVITYPHSNRLAIQNDTHKKKYLTYFTGSISYGKCHGFYEIVQRKRHDNLPAGVHSVPKCPPPPPSPNPNSLKHTPQFLFNYSFQGTPVIFLANIIPALKSK